MDQENEHVRTRNVRSQEVIRDLQFNHLEEKWCHAKTVRAQSVIATPVQVRKWWSQKNAPGWKGTPNLQKQT